MEPARGLHPAQPILDRCEDEGFVSTGVATASASSTSDHLLRWLEQGSHGEMTWLESNLPLRVDPRELLPGARSVIVVADRYDGSPDPPLPAGAGRLARYARGRDYHVYMKKRLHRLADVLARDFPGETFRACVDTAPILEREVAAAAGLGSIGKNTLLIQPRAGSWMLLGELVTTLAIAPTHADSTSSDPCKSCSRCIEACPTGAISPWSVNARECVSYLTIEHRGRIDPAYHEGIGEWLFGCDACQEACPHNQPKGRARTPATDPEYRARPEGRVADGTGFDLMTVLNWTEEERRQAFTTSSMKRAKLDMIRRNAVIVAGNTAAGDPDSPLWRRLEEIAGSESEQELVRRTAQDVIARGGGNVSRDASSSPSA